MPEKEIGLAAATLRLAGEDIYVYGIGKDREGLDTVSFDFGDVNAEHAARVLDETLAAHGDGAHDRADLAYRLAVVDAAFRPTPAFDGLRQPSAEVRQQLEGLIGPALRTGGNLSAADIVDVFEHAHATGTRAQVPAIIGSSVATQSLAFLTLECSVRGESVIVDGAAETAMALFDYQETTMSLSALQGMTDPFNWPSCNEAFKSVKAIPGSYWESPPAYGVDIIEVFALPFSFSTTTALSITYISGKQQALMTYDLSTKNAAKGDGKVAVDRGFARATDFTTYRRAEALKVVHFRDDDQANAASWFACMWWDLLSVRTATLCPNKTVTPKSALKARAGSTNKKKNSSSNSSTTTPKTTSPATTPGSAEPGQLEATVLAWGELVSGFARESVDLATRTAKRWPAGETVTGGKLTSDLIEGFERLTPSIGKSIDFWLDAAQKATNGFSSSAMKQPDSGGSP